MDAARARAIYEEIVRRKRDPALIELVGHGMLRARVFPINPGETRKITLRYTQLMSRAGDALQFRYTAGTRRTGRPSVTGEDRAWSRPPADAPLSFELVADSAGTLRDPFSPTHELNSTRDRDRLTVRPASALSGELVVFLPLARGLVGLTAAAHRPAGEDGYFMFNLSPGQGEGRPLPRDVTAVIDVSGSMSGQKIAQARAALRQLVRSLSPTDRFRLIAFNGTVAAYRSGWTEATGGETAASPNRPNDRAAAPGCSPSGSVTTSTPICWTA
jgi:Ca-activated chloride channel family protein